MNSKPLVSVLMPVYNAEDFVVEAAKSILDQTYDRLELIIVDDCCTDASIERVLSLHDKRISILRNVNNIGLAASLNLAIKHSSGMYLARMDADDISEPTRIEQQVNRLEENPEISVLGTGLQYFNTSSYANYFPETHESCKSKLLFNVCFGHPSVVFRREVFDDPNNLYNPELRQYSEDYDLYSRLVDQFQFANLHKLYVRYRTFEPSIKKGAEARRKQNSKVVRTRLLNAMGLFPSEKEQELHRMASDLVTCLDQRTFNDIGLWFNFLHERNKVSAYFNGTELSYALGEQLFLLAYHNPHLKVSINRLISDFPYFGDYSVSFRLLLKYEAKKILRTFN